MPWPPSKTSPGFSGGILPLGKILNPKPPLSIEKVLPIDALYERCVDCNLPSDHVKSILRSGSGLLWLVEGAVMLVVPRPGPAQVRAQPGAHKKGILTRCEERGRHKINETRISFSKTWTTATVGLCIVMQQTSRVASCRVHLSYLPDRDEPSECATGLVRGSRCCGELWIAHNTVYLRNSAEEVLLALLRLPDVRLRRRINVLSSDTLRTIDCQYSSSHTCATNTGGSGTARPLQNQPIGRP
ncbi:unnamed protein product [Pleuronectes platessa]|uniref:Uncharacterized protein n=1 Tax=Pleuronectes platessa TaxID=8262 RepID=A0A9N7YZM6_PLEPL|nr:unnamed protein product [Pleuronectes platessa]